jgi:acyl-CoA synthetase (AMP-forming)/AMP-acid ligase II
MFVATQSHRLTRPVLASLNFGSPWIRRRTALSVVEGTRDPPLDNRTLHDYFAAEVVSPRPERPALICPEERPRAHGGPLPRNMGVEKHLAWDFSEFDRHVRALARGLVSLGAKKGDRVGVIMGNTRYACLGMAVLDRSKYIFFVQRVCDVAVGMCEHRSYSRHYQSCLSCSRVGELP